MNQQLKFAITLSTLVLGALSVRADALNLSTKAANLNLVSGALQAFTGNVANSGTILVNAAGANTRAKLRFDANDSIDGSGAHGALRSGVGLNEAKVLGAVTCVPAPGGMISWWPGNGNANDVQGGNNGTLQGSATFAAGEVGQAFSFSGTSDDVLVPHSDNQNTGAQISVDAWVLVSNAFSGTATLHIVNKQTPNVNDGYRLEIVNAGQPNALNFEIITSDGLFFIQVQNVITPGVWQHLAGTYDGLTIRIYVNGSEVGNSPASGSIVPVTGDLMIGLETGQSTPWLVDEVELFDRALSQSEIQAIYNAGSAGKCPCVSPPDNLVSWWPGDDNAHDIQGMHNGTLVNGATFASGEVSDAFSFSAADDGVTVPDSPAFRITQNLSIDAWINVTAFSRFMEIFMRGDSRNFLDPYYLAAHDDVVRFHIEDASGNIVNLEAPINAGEWVHVAGTLEDATGDMRLYVNGALANETTTTIRPFADLDPASNPGIGIGNTQDANGQGFNGLIDEVELFDRTLSANEITSLYDAGGAGKCKPQATPTPTPPPPPTDFNGDGHPDYVLFNASTRRTAVWYLNNNAFLGSAYGPTLPAGWTVIDVADFNRDGHPDYALFNSSTRRTVIWYLSGPTFLGSALAPTLPSGWQLVASRDFDADGQADFVLYNAGTRQTAVWYLNNNVFLRSALGPTLPAGWSLAGIADFDRDGQQDYLLFNATTRQSAIWYLSGTTFLRAAFGPANATRYALIGTEDFNADSDPDFVLQNHTSQRTAIWYFHNNVYVTSAYGPTLPAGWDLVAP